jgi:hypothetical protein
LNPNGEHFVQIRQRTKRQPRLRGKTVYKRRQLELTIPSKFKDVVEPFLNKDLKVEAKRVGNKIIIEAKPIENTPSNRLELRAHK